MLTTRRLILLLVFSCLYLSQAYAQPKAGFNFNTSGGCAPLTVSISNSSTGLGPNATFAWDFGNGITSTLREPSVVFLTAQSYIVTLTVREGNNSSVVSKNISVYQPPVFDFIPDTRSGCLPLAVNFLATQTGGDGSVANWHWDFGDGTTTSVNTTGATHFYQHTSSANVSLTAVSQYGCASSIVKPALIDARGNIKPSFTANEVFFCTDPATVNFTNTSTGSGTLTSFWNFGDGSTSTQQSPSHTYTSRGRFTVTLTVTSSDGCSVADVKNEFINVADFTTDFAVPSVICALPATIFHNTSSPKADRSTWYVDGTEVTWNAPADSLIYYFNTNGTHTVRLRNQYGSCVQETTKTVTVYANPELTGFISAFQYCNGSTQITFRDTTASAAQWKWNFEGADTTIAMATTREAFYSFDYTGIHQVNLLVRNARGCYSSVYKTIDIVDPDLYITTTDANASNWCDSLTKKFKAITPLTITTYLWNFGDGTTSTLAEPEHTFKPGQYRPYLTYTTDYGCTFRVDLYDYIGVYKKPVADFTVTPFDCGNTRVQLNSAGTGWYEPRWYFGEGNFTSNNLHDYTEPGVYDITLIAVAPGCNDTITKKALIKVTGPFLKLWTGGQNTCDGDRGEVRFLDFSTDVDKWTWNFGDGETLTYTVQQPVITHHYNRSGEFTSGRLSVEKDGCVISTNIYSRVMLKSDSMKLTIDNSTACINADNSFLLTGHERNYFNLLHYNWSYDVIKMEYKDGSTVPARTWLAPSPNLFRLAGVFTPDDIRTDSVRVITQAQGFGCYDTSSYALVSVQGVKPGFEIAATPVCYKSPVVFNDTSGVSGTSIIRSRRWDFGDGTTLTTSSGGTVSHTYAAPGVYLPKLTIDDGEGCLTTASAGTGITVGGPVASFYFAGGNNSLVDEQVYPFNTSNVAFTTSASLSWNFGDGYVSTDQNPAHAYSTPGTYTVQLTVTDPASGCSDVSTQTIIITLVPPPDPPLPPVTEFRSATLFVGNHDACPPVQATYTYSTTGTFTRLVWDFGDGTTMEGNLSVSHNYLYAGTYPVRLDVYDNSGIIDSRFDTVRVSVPSVTLAAPDLEACLRESIGLNTSLPSSAYSYTWDFGNGFVAQGTENFAGYTYPAAGSYRPSLVVTDAKGCASAASLASNLVIHPDPTIAINTPGNAVCKDQPVQLVASGGTTYNWSPATGLNNSSIVNPLASPVNATTYSVEGTDVHGCKSSATMMVNVALPISLAGTSSLDLCEGKTGQLLFTGADSYRWIGNTTGLSSTNLANPTVRPVSSAAYMLVGADRFNCYTDTIRVPVTVRPSPTINAGADQEILSGTPLTLVATGSSDIIRWNWSPASYLSCTNCPSPVSTAIASVEYQLTVTNQYSCEASDKVRVNTLCKDGNVSIPNAFTPNADGLNDLFLISGQGINKVHHFRVFNRWGEIVFERRNFTPGSTSNGWNGKYKGYDAPTGTYVFNIEMECAAGIKFERKGVVTLIR